MGCQSNSAALVQSTSCTPTQPPIVIEQRTIGVEILPGKSVAKAEKGVNQKYLEYVNYMSQFWRICKLALPKYKNKKFVSCDEKGDGKSKIPVKLPDHVHFYSENLGWPTVRLLQNNKALHEKCLGRKWKKTMRKHLSKSWGTIYNFYNRRKLIQIRMYSKRMKQEKKAKRKKRSADEVKKIYGRLAAPKQPPQPEKKKKKPKRDIDYERNDLLAKPKEVYYVKPELPKISPKALKYNATAGIIKLAQLPSRYETILPPLELPRPVSQAAKKYVATEYIKSLTKPLERHCDGKVITYEPEEKNTDAFKVNPKALTYKITARLKKLAEPKEHKY